MAAPPLPVFAPQAAWYRLTFGLINPSLADTVPNISFLAPFTDSGGTLQDGLVGGLDGAIIFLAGIATARDGGQKFLMWDEDSLVAANGTTVFNPYVVTGTPGRWISAQAPSDPATVPIILVITAGGTKAVAASTSLTIRVLVDGRSVAGATTLTPPVSPILGQSYSVKDANGDAGTSNIIWNSTTDGIATARIVANYGELTFTWNGTEWGIG